MNPHFLFLLYILTAVSGQSCKNSGIQNGSSCACPVGFTGSDCSTPACGSDLFSSSRPSTTQMSNGFPNLTASACTCEADWIGLGCNVCKTSNACQAAFAASGHSSSGTIGSDTGINSTLVCNRQSQVWASGQTSCNVINPTLQAIYPKLSTLNIIRTLDPTLSPIPNTTSFGTAGTAFAQLFYDGVEQFFCSADSCAQSLKTADSGNSSTYTCQNLKCSCIGGTSFCGGSGGSTLDLTNIINGLGGGLTIDCDAIDSSTQQATCRFEQQTLQSVFGSSGLALSGCTFGECVRQSVLDGSTSTNGTSTEGGGNHLSGGVIAGLAVVGSLILLALVLLLFGCIMQRKARRVGYRPLGGAKAGVEWSNVTYVVAGTGAGLFGRKKSVGYTDDKVILDHVSGSIGSGQMMAILGPSGAGKTTLVEILAGKHKSGTVSGSVTFPSSSSSSQLRIGFVPQQDVLPPMLSVYEAILFAARLRLPEGISDTEKRERVDRLIGQLGLQDVRDTRIGDGHTRGISGGEMRRVSIGLELIACPDILILDEPTSGLDSVSASRLANLLHSIAHDAENPTAVIASIHQPSSQLYHIFDSILVLSHGMTVYSGKGGFAPAMHLQSISGVQRYQQGYNVADYVLEVASDPPLVVFQQNPSLWGSGERGSEKANGIPSEKSSTSSSSPLYRGSPGSGSRYATTFLTQLQYLSGREWKILRRDKTLFFTHLAVAAVLGVFCGGLYFKTGITIAGFQSRVGCLFFLGALIAFSTLSALYNVVEIRPLFLRERSSAYYSPTVWLLARFIFDAVPLRIIPTIVVSSVTYWMAGLAGDAAHFFKFLFILVLYTLAMTLFNFLLGTMFNNGGIAILLSALTALYQMTFAGFFVHLSSIPPVLRWLQWLCPLKYCLEALSVNEVGSGLMIEDSLEGVPISVSAALIMNTLFGFGANNYYRDVLVLFAFIAGFGLGMIGIVWIKVRERR